MKVKYEEILLTDFNALREHMRNLKLKARSMNEILEVECHSLKPGWMPSMEVLFTADKITIDEKVVKDRFGGKVGKII